MTSFPATRAAIAGLFLVNGLLFSSWVSRIPDVKQRVGLDESRLGLALLCMGLGTFLALPVVSVLIARHGSRAVCAGSALCCTIFLPLAGWAPSFVSLSGVLVLYGAAMGSMDVAMNAQASMLERQAGRSIMSSFHAIWSLGGLTGATLGGLFAERARPPFAHFLVVCAVLALLSVLACLALLRDQGDASHPPLSWPSRPVLAIGFVAACAAVVEGGLADWSALYLRDSLGQSAGYSTSGYAAFSLAMMVGRFAGDRLIDRFGALALLRAGGVLAGAAVAAALAFRQPLVAVLAFALAGLGMSAVFPIAFSAAGSLRAAVPGTALAAVATMAYGGSLTGPPLIGFVAGATSLPAALALLVLACAAIVLLAGRLPLPPSPAAGSS